MVTYNDCRGTLISSVNEPNLVVVRDCSEGVTSGLDDVLRDKTGDIREANIGNVRVAFTPSVLPIFGSSDTDVVLKMILDERRRQDDKWGGPDHDDTHELGVWLDMIKDRVNEIHKDYSLAARRTTEVQNLLIEVAAIAAAAVESSYRAQRW